ncbi:DUF624 domain-containing protein [Gryllotalpicola ginsengisoli]|uniref:DUF624 domain-containing protein n=1 Tax=Gryllotalpicola ginsengisoli TaxID=444608 RepID=UPI0003B3515C|nr:DUF624 domain-containing protein [Gryllotalpicola ginsengisoli]
MARFQLPAVGQGVFDSVFGYVYTGLAVNLSLVAANFPLAAALVLVRDPLAAWPFLLLLSLTVAPSLAAAFAAFRALADGGTAPFGAFWRGWLRTLRPAFLVGLGVGALALVIGLDLATTAGTPVGALLAPVLLVVLAVVCAAAAITLAVVCERVAEGTDASLGAAAKASVYLAVRHAPLSALTLVVLGAAAAAVLAQPVFGALLAVSPLLYLAWANSRYALLRVRSAA